MDPWPKKFEADGDSDSDDDIERNEDGKIILDRDKFIEDMEDMMYKPPGGGGGRGRNGSGNGNDTNLTTDWWRDGIDVTGDQRRNRTWPKQIPHDPMVKKWQ